MQAWSDFLQNLEKEIGAKTVMKWLTPLKVCKFDARNLFLEAENPLQLSWFEEHIRPRLKSDFLNQNEKPFSVFIELSKTHLPNQKKSVEEPKDSFSLYFEKTDPELTFEDFSTTQENKVVFELLRTCTEVHFNPIYIYGPRFCGKTHLLNACALAFQKSGKNVFYVKASTFTSHVVQAIRRSQMQVFRNAYRTIDALIVDDVDQFAKKTATQEEFFHTFNTLHTAGKQLIFAASTPPSLLKNIEPRLMSRFEWGISLKLESATPIEILRKKASLWNIPCSEPLLNYLAIAFPHNPLSALQALCLRTKTLIDLSVDKAKILLEDLLVTENKTPISLELVVKKTAHYFGIRETDILGKGQTKEFAHPRKIAMFLCRDLLGLPYQKIGAEFQRDHSTVMSSIKSIQNKKEKKEMIDALASIDQSLRS